MNTEKIFLLQIILTHEHADAIFGLDDVRIVQSFIPFSTSNDIDPTPVYATKFTMDRARVCSFASYSIISKSGEQLDLLIIDTNSLHMVSSRSTHLCFSEDLNLYREGIPVQLAYDGLRVFIDL
ncbi:hypothetical protein B296_00031376 [Ensete ventricosum]|uniref:Metallo-beta-lactamase domain-containing protein n=1 Tax=Ensete ventricosum TaxID=4639 RepID=A0A426YMI7_ENSVE|nr:hypothetical protein B296_00031376 [Ensete ventricosum]